MSWNANSSLSRLLLTGIIGSGVIGCGCARHQERPMITAVGLSPANRCDPPGIPYYLPKPLLVVSKNVRHIDESKVGLTGPVPIPGGFDNQAAYADVKANVTVPPGGAADGNVAGLQAANVPAANVSSASVTEHGDQSMVAENMTPSSTDNFDGGVEVDSFFTYQVIFVPDLTQKYGLQITGGAGEFRAAMNMVNGWMYTGMGPFYLKDSSSAQNAMATGVAAMYAGRGVADVVSSVGDLASTFTGAAQRQSSLTDAEMMELNSQVQALETLANMTPKVPKEMLNFAEIYIYEPHLLPGDTTEWRLVAEHHFDRHYLATTDSPALEQTRNALFQDVIQKAALGSTGKSTNLSQQTIEKLSQGVANELKAGTTRDTQSALTNPDIESDPFAERDASTGSGISSGTEAREDGKVEMLNPPLPEKLIPPGGGTSIQFNMLPSTAPEQETTPARPHRFRELVADHFNLGKGTIQRSTGDTTLRVK